MRLRTEAVAELRRLPEPRPRFESVEREPATPEPAFAEDEVTQVEPFLTMEELVGPGH